jgi:hypothetical protein
VEGGTVLCKWIFILLEESLVIKPDGEGPIHWALAEFKNELDEGHTRAAAVGFGPIVMSYVLYTTSYT